jgi:hypothetical protein
MDVEGMCPSIPANSSHFGSAILMQIIEHFMAAN